MKNLIYFLLIISTLAHSETYPVHLGEATVNIIRWPGKGKTFVHLHENEQTAVLAAKRYIAQEGGTLITLKHAGTRNIVFHLHHIRYEFDPNRIFTDNGIKKTLHQLGPYSPEAHHAVKILANKIVALLPKKGKVIAVHNNRGYSLKDYFPHHTLEQDTQAIHHVPSTSYRNFYFVTQSKDYERLRRLKFNVALQAPHATDDGSLSYYLGHRHYINIEAAYSALKQQIAMLYHA